MARKPVEKSETEKLFLEYGELYLLSDEQPLKFSRNLYKDYSHGGKWVITTDKWMYTFYIDHTAHPIFEKNITEAIKKTIEELKITK
jgi:hypothetical protein